MTATLMGGDRTRTTVMVMFESGTVSVREFSHLEGPVRIRAGFLPDFTIALQEGMGLPLLVGHPAAIPLVRAGSRAHSDQCCGACVTLNGRDLLCPVMVTDDEYEGWCDDADKAYQVMANCHRFTEIVVNDQTVWAGTPKADYHRFWEMAKGDKRVWPGAPWAR